MADPYACGYVNGLAASPITCQSGYCGFNPLIGAAGCCASTVPGAGYSLTDCTYTTTCYNSIDATDLDFNSMDLRCTDSASPYCARYTFTDSGYAALFCSDTATILEAATTADDAGAAATETGGGTAAATGASVTEKFPAATSADAAASTGAVGRVATSKAGPVASETGGAAGNPFPTTQGSAAGLGSATMVSGNGCAGGGPGKVGVVAIVAAVAGILMGC